MRRESREHSMTSNAPSRGSGFGGLPHLRCKADQFIQLRRLVKHPIRTHRQTPLPHGRREVVAQHHHALAGSFLQALEHVQPAAFGEEEVEHGQVPGGFVFGEPLDGVGFCAGPADDAGVGLFFEGVGEVVAGGVAVFNQEGFEACHAGILGMPEGCCHRGNAI